MPKLANRPGALALLAMTALPFAAPAADRVLISDVIIQGNRQVPTGQIKNTIKARPGREFLPSEAQEDVRALYATRLFRDVSAHQQPDGPGQVKLLFLVRDFANDVKKVHYVGAQHLRKDDLDQLAGIRLGSPLSPHTNQLACQKIVARYNDDGRPFATCVLLRGASPSDTEVVFHITEGPRVKVRDVRFTGNTFVSAAVLRQHIKTSSGPLGLGLVGGDYHPPMIEADASELQKYYRGLGFQDVRVARELLYSAGGQDVTVIFHVAEGPRYRILSAPKVRGTRCVPPERLEALAKVKAGDFYDQRKIDHDLAVLKDYLGYTGRDVRTQAVPVYSPETPGVIASLIYEVSLAQPVNRARGQAPN